MKKRCRLLLLSVSLVSCVLQTDSIASALDVPPLRGYINDYADMMSSAAEAQLELELKTFENTDSTQIVILTIPSLEGEPIEQFSIKVAESWKIGHKGKDNGIIFLAAKQDRKMRIEVGRGLEGKLTDLMAGRIIDLVVKPRFKRGDFDGGFISGIHALTDATKGEFKAEPDHHTQTGKEPSSLFTFLIFGGSLLVFLGSISRLLSAATGAVGLPAYVYATKMSVSSSTLLFTAFWGMVIGFLLPHLFSAGRIFRSGRGGYRGGWVSSGSSDFSGGGGFTSGGGSFGGGGASGDW